MTKFSSVQSLSRVRLFVTPWTAACQASLFIPNSRSLLKLMSIESVMPSNHLILVIPFSSCLQSFQALGSFPMSQFFKGSQSIGLSALASVLPMNIQGWFPLGLIGLISFQSKRLSGVFSSSTIWKHQFSSAQPSSWFNSHICTWLLEKPWLPITSDPPQWRYLPLFPAWFCLASETLLFPPFEMVSPPLVLQRRAHTSSFKAYLGLQARMNHLLQFVF